MILLIPSYEPTPRLLDVIDGIRSAAPWVTVLVVDDGSGPAFTPVFDAARDAGARVLSYPRNHGKGHALKTGFQYVLSRWPDSDIVCADGDGQHSTTDILRVMDELATADGAIVLGGRRFTGDVPARSRVGNTLTRGAFRVATGVAVHDTQTGLRGYPAAVVPWLPSVRGERFEYELSLLTRARAAGHRMREITIDTIYLDENSGSHFRPIRDSVRVFAPLLAFGASSFLAFLIDTAALWLLSLLTGSLWLSVLGARVLSGGVNFLVNRRLVFGGRGRLRRDALRYGGLALALVGASYLSLLVLTGWGVPLLLAKVVSETALYLLSFAVQARLFAARPTRQPAPLRVTA